MEKLSLSCDQCGSVDVEMVDDNIGKCNHCGTKFLIIPKKDEDSEDDAEDFEPIQGCFAIKPNRDMEWFKRKAIIDLFLDSNTPLDIGVATLGEPFENITQTLMMTTFYEGECVADIGYISPFASGYSYDDSDYSWSPFKTRFRTDVKSTFTLDEGEGKGELRHPLLSADKTLISCMKKKLDSSEYICSMQELGVAPVELTDDIIEKALRDNKDELQYNIDLPGDNQKIVSIMASHKIVSLLRVAEKQYILPGEYKGKKFEIVAPAGAEQERRFYHFKDFSLLSNRVGIYRLEELGIKGKRAEEYENYPIVGETENEAKHRIYTNKKKKKTTLASTIALIAGLAGVVACSFSFLIGVGIIALSIAGYNMFKKARDNYYDKILAQLSEQIGRENPLNMSKEFRYKLSWLEAELKKRGLAPITREELEIYLAGYSSFGYDRW